MHETDKLKLIKEAVKIAQVIIEKTGKTDIKANIAGETVTIEISDDVVEVLLKKAESVVTAFENIKDKMQEKGIKHEKVKKNLVIAYSEEIEDTEQIRILLQ